MDVFCTAADEFDAEAIIVDLKEAGLADTEITVRISDESGAIAISVHADEARRASKVKSIVSEAGGQDVSLRTEVINPECAAPTTALKRARPFGGPLKVFAISVLEFCTGR
jgi:hypothetical protein